MPIKNRELGSNLNQSLAEKRLLGLLSEHPYLMSSYNTITFFKITKESLTE